jgi:hypothetical protein
MIADNRIPAGEVHDMHVSQTKTKIQVDLHIPLELRDGAPVREATVSALALKRHMAMLSLKFVHPNRPFQRPAAEDARSLGCRARKGFGLCRRCHH